LPWFVLVIKVVEGGRSCKIWMGFLMVLLSQIAAKNPSYVFLIMVTFKAGCLSSLAAGRRTSVRGAPKLLSGGHPRQSWLGCRLWWSKGDPSALTHRRWFLPTGDCRFSTTSTLEWH
jgi:hypothetical protein